MRNSPGSFPEPQTDLVKCERTLRGGLVHQVLTLLGAEQRFARFSSRLHAKAVANGCRPQRGQPSRRDVRQCIQISPARQSADDLQTHVDQFQNQEQLAGIALYDARGKPLATISTMAYVRVTPPAVIKSVQTGHVQGGFLRQANLSLHVLALPIIAETRLLRGDLLQI